MREARGVKKPRKMSVLPRRFIIMGNLDDNQFIVPLTGHIRAFPRNIALESDVPFTSHERATIHTDIELWRRVRGRSVSWRPRLVLFSRVEYGE